MSSPESALVMNGPVGGGSFPRAYDRLANTGTTEDSNAAKLPEGAMATILVGAAAVRFSLRATLAAATQVATTDPIIPAYGRFDWTVTPDTTVIYVEAADGSSAYEAWVWSSSPPLV